MNDAQQTFAYERYLDQRAKPDGLVRDDLPYSSNLDQIVEAVNRRFRAAFLHGDVYQAISHMARKPDLRKRGLRRESDIPLHSGRIPAVKVSKVAERKRVQRQLAKQMRALSIRQPFAEQILAGDKQIEYRSRRTHIRGRVYIYACKAPGDADSYEGLPRGKLVGTVELVDCTGEKGKFKWHLANPKRLRSPLAVEGMPQPGFFWPFGN